VTAIERWWLVTHGLEPADLPAAWLIVWLVIGITESSVQRFWAKFGRYGRAVLEPAYGRLMREKIARDVLREVELQARG
jgi:hypothetical protein